jgi:hypothetical protein
MFLKTPGGMILKNDRARSMLNYYNYFPVQK